MDDDYGDGNQSVLRSSRPGERDSSSRVPEQCPSLGDGEDRTDLVLPPGYSSVHLSGESIHEGPRRPPRSYYRKTGTRKSVWADETGPYFDYVPLPHTVPLLLVVILVPRAYGPETPDLDVQVRLSVLVGVRLRRIGGGLVSPRIPERLKGKSWTRLPLRP